jgi:hypothetical protein
MFGANIVHRYFQKFSRTKEQYTTSRTSLRDDVKHDTRFACGGGGLRTDSEARAEIAGGKDEDAGE